MTKTRKVKVFVDVGSHGGVFVFAVGPVAARYPGLMHIYDRKAPGLLPATLTYAVRKTKKAPK